MESNKRTWPGRKALLGGVGAVITGVLIAVFTPPAEGLRDRLFNRDTTLRGVVVLGDEPVVDATVSLDEKQSVATDNDGQFELTDVAFGRHALDVRATLAHPLSNKRLDLPRKPDRLPPLYIDLAPRFQPDGGATEKVLTPSEFGEEPRNRWQVAIWLRAERDALRNLASVDYRLPGKVGIASLRSRKAGNRFCVERTFTTDFMESGQDTNPIEVTLKFKNGRTYTLPTGTLSDLFELQGRPHPPKCP